MMRQILVDAARARQAGKRGSGNLERFTETMEIGENKLTVDFLAVHEALEKLEKHSRRLAHAVPSGKPGCAGP